ncbi:MAG: hypothetical protein WBR15_10715 [Gammaproteobacteria bacterium]
MGLWSRSFNLYRLKKKYRLQIVGFQFAGMFLAFYLITVGVIKYQELARFKPGTPLQLNAHTLLMVAIFMIVFLSLLAVCMLLGSLVQTVDLALTGQMTFTQAVGACFAAKYPPEWFKPGKQHLS